MNLTDTGNGNGFDLVFQNDASLFELQRVLAEAFNIPFEQVRVDLLRENYDYDYDSLTERVWCIANKEAGGEFHWHLDITVRDKKLDFSDKEAAQRICDASGSNVLYTNSTPNPFEWFLLSPKVEKRIAWVNPDCFDDGITIITRIFEPGESTNGDDF